MTPEQVLEIERRVPAPPETVFSYFTDPRKHAQWQGVAVELEARPGGRYLVHFSARSRVRGEYVVVDPPRKLVLTWGWEGDEATPFGTIPVLPGSSTVEIDFEPDGEETLLTLRHSGLPPEEPFFMQGWGFYLPRLDVVVTGADAGPDPLGAFLAEVLESGR